MRPAPQLRGRCSGDAVSEVGLEPDLLDDCILMASELAANTPHARAVAGTGGGGDRFVSVAPDMGGEPISSAGPVPHTPHTPHIPRAPAAFAAAQPGCPELWLYLRGLGTRRELARKVFDCYRGWRHGSAPSTAWVPAQAVHAVAGRGLQIVHELSCGRWGHHPTRASERLSARQAAAELEAMLDERGFGGQLVRADQPASDMSVLSVCRGLTVWCRSGVVSMTSPEGDRERWSYADLVEAAEQTVRRYEELELGLDLAVAGA
jgi:hypothetical protein